MSGFDRRRLLRYGAAAAIVTATAAGAQSVAAPGSAAKPDRSAPPEKDPRDFDTDYKGKKIKGEHDKQTKKHRVTVNGKKLAVMEIELPAAEGATGTVIAVVSALTHYEPFLLDEDRNKDGLLKMTKKAIDTLGDTELTALAGEQHDHGR